MPDNLQAFKAEWFCWHKISSLSKCLCSQCLGSPFSSYSNTSRAANSREQEETLPQGAHKFCPCKATTQVSQIPPLCCTSPHAASSLPAQHGGYWGTSHPHSTPAWHLQHSASVLFQKKDAACLSLLEEGCSSLSQSVRAA